MRSSVTESWVHTRTSVGRTRCIDPPAEPPSVEGGLLPLAVGTDAEWDESVKTGRQVKLIVRERQLLEALQKIKELNYDYQRGVSDGLAAAVAYLESPSLIAKIRALKEKV